jgi:hypothetical protein
MKLYVFGVGFIRDESRIRMHATALGVPEHVTLVSCLGLPNPHYQLPASVPDKDLIAWFRGTPQRAAAFDAAVAEAERALLEDGAEIALYCHGGKHRSRAVALAMKERDERNVYAIDFLSA